MDQRFVMLREDVKKLSFIFWLGGGAINSINNKFWNVRDNQICVIMPAGEGLNPTWTVWRLPSNMFYISPWNCDCSRWDLGYI